MNVRTVSVLADALGKGLVGGLAGTAAMTASSTLEMKIRGRGASFAPAEGICKVLHLETANDQAEARLNNLVHWGYGRSRLGCKTITFGKSFWRGGLQDSTKTGQEHVRHMPGSLERILVKHLEGSKNIGPDDFVFCRSDDDPRPHDPDHLRREVLYPVLDRCGIKRTPRAGKILPKRPKT